MKKITILIVLAILALVLVLAAACNEYPVQRTNNRAIEALKAAFPNAECSSWSISNNDFMPDVALCKAPDGVLYCRAGAWTAPQCITFAKFAPQASNAAPAQK